MSVIGYGITKEDAAVDSIINLCLISPNQIQTHNELKVTFDRLHPWLPTETSLQITGIGYFKVDGVNIIYIDNDKNKKVYELSTPFKSIYEIFFDRLSFIELVVCLPYIEHLFKKVSPSLKLLVGSYGVVVPQSFDSINGTVVMTNNLCGVLCDGDTIGFKSPEFNEFWSHQIVNNNIIDTLYYIAYRIGYSNIKDLLEL